jgi:hypothetical protein
MVSEWWICGGGTLFFVNKGPQRLHCRRTPLSESLSLSDRWIDSMQSIPGGTESIKQPNRKTCAKFGDFVINSYNRLVCHDSGERSLCSLNKSWSHRPEDQGWYLEARGAQRRLEHRINLLGRKSP